MSSTGPVRVAELVGQAVADLGAAHAFGVVGSGNFAVTNALVAAGVPFVAARHEGGAATMADAYARTSGRVAVVSVHQGCGLTNAMTGITEAAKSRTPLVVLAADVAGSAVGSNFRIDQDALIRSVGAVPERVHSPESAVDDVIRAYRTASHGRRTVVLNLPLDVQAAEVERRRLEPLAPGRADGAGTGRRRRPERSCSATPSARCSWRGAERCRTDGRSPPWPTGSVRC